MGILIGWLNTALIAAAGFYAWKRWPELRFFPVYALAVAVTMVIGKLPGFYTPEFYILRSVGTQLLCLVAVAETLRWRGRWWLVLAAIAMVVPAVVPMDAALRYQLIREALVVVLAALVMVSRRHPAVLGWAVYGVAVLASDVFKLAVPESAWMLLRVVDPAVYTVMCGVWLWSLMTPERVRWMEKIRAVVGEWRNACAPWAAWKRSREADNLAALQSGQSAGIQGEGKEGYQRNKE